MLTTTPICRAMLPDGTRRGVISEVGFIRFGDVRVLVVVVLVAVFGADAFAASVCRRVGERRGPGRGEDACILDRHMRLEELVALVPSPGVAVEQPILFPVPFECVFSGWQALCRWQPRV